MRRGWKPRLINRLSPSGFIESVIRASASARNRADLAFGGGFRDHRRGTKLVRRSQINARILFDFVVYADQRRYRELVVTRGPRGRQVVERNR